MDHFVKKGSLIVIASLFVLLAKGIAHPYYYSSNNIPLDSWIYTAIDKLESLGFVESVFHGNRPYTRIEAARIVSEALKKRKKMEEIKDHPADPILKRLKKEFRDELIITGYSKGEFHSIFVKPLDEVNFDFVRISGKERRFVSPPGTQGSPLVENNEGIVYAEGNNLEWRYGFGFQLTEVFSFYFEPLMLINEENGLRDNDWRLHKGYMKFTLFGVETEVGKDSIWWGQGYHGSLILSNNAEPFRMIKVQTPYPFVLPWFFSYLGAMKVSGFITVLDKNRPVENPRMLGLRVDIKPYPAVEIGASRTIIFGGRGAPHINFEEFIKILRGTNLTGGADTSNQMAGFDWRLRIPFLRGLSLYGEHIGEDEAGSFPSKFGTLLGIYMPWLFKSGSCDLRVEFTETHSTFYTHGRWPYTYKGLIMGHHAGGDAEDIFVRMGFGLSERISGGLFYDYQKRGRSVKESEKGDAFGIEFQIKIGSHGSAYLEFDSENIRNFNFSGSDRRNEKFSLGFSIEM